MCDTHELAAWPKTLVITNTDEAVVWEERWQSSTGVASVDFVLDVRNRTLGTSAAIELKPALQLAAVRTDRPDGGAQIADGTVVTDEGATHFRETLSAASKFFWRRGISYKLSSGSFACVETRLYTTHRQAGRVFPTRKVIVQPTNDTADVSYYPITGRFPTVGVDDAKLAVVLQGNANAKLEWRLAGRVTSDPQAPGDWTNLEAAWNTTAAGDSVANTGEVALTSLSPSSDLWLELALAVRKNAAGDSNSRAILHVIPAVTYT